MVNVYIDVNHGDKSSNFITTRETQVDSVKINNLISFCALLANTIAAHRKNTLNKADCKNTAELIVKCIKEGLL